MEHKGIPYTVVQTASPTGFRWTVEMDAHKSKTGVCSSRGNAIFNAIRAIEKALDTLPKQK
jgi:hypothetical protein